MSITTQKDAITVTSGYKILDFTINTTGVNMFVSNCSIVESKKSTYSVGNCTTVNCTTVQCTTVNCTTVDCNTVKCRDCSYDADCQCDCCSDS